MKLLQKYILGSLLMLTAVMSSIEASAQTENKYKSRLDMKPKQKTSTSASTVSSLRKSTFSYFQPYSNTLDRGIHVQRSTAINQYFSNSLLSQQSAKTVAKNEVTNNNAVAETARTEEALNAEEHLFSNDKLWVSNIFPNPADDHADINFNISSQVSEAKITFYNILGSEVKEEILEKDQRKSRISTKDWPNGIYLYQLTADGRSLVTKKLLVRHQ
ncbi:T9SS type A sorting domain-containing protein [Flectobacillus rivi]|jgi:hypothetical protein|uniref:T9SS type A sorting domain-containing protein n=1 Tax=Flectobacillus rivi TaxID=2984209 RepID=A0ABT6Z597_9BACT|nr:T9SS type A sorting domain-containing protein [Flectobacillus rivi]MDI9876293.1 T9SS type A sorting domain-containing protein [Flectobacillus rivi]